MKTIYHFTTDILPMSKALLGFSYTAGKCIEEDEESQEQITSLFEEWSIGIILLQFTVTRHKI